MSDAGSVIWADYGTEPYISRVIESKIRLTKPSFLHILIAETYRI